MRIALIMNDQDEGLVDTSYAQALKFEAREVTGGCFCCRFSDLIDAAESLANYAPQVIFAEPVGSCVDLSATILQPILTFHNSKFKLAPLTVLVDAESLNQLFRGSMNASVEFLFRNQIAEADLLCISKQDAMTPVETMFFPIDFHLSARTGFGVDQWLQEVLHPTRTVGAKLLDIDYDQYADAEAALGWLNLHCVLELDAALPPSLVVGPLLDVLCSSLQSSHLPIAHLKIFDRTANGWVKASVTASAIEPQPEGDLLADPACRHSLAVNLRAVGDPAHLEAIVMRELKGIFAEMTVTHLKAFRPSRPVPQHRLSR